MPILMQDLISNSEARLSQPCGHVIVVVPFWHSDKQPIFNRIIDIASSVAQPKKGSQVWHDII
jgi:hypothetical protein